MDAFRQAIDGWHDFYLMIGTAGATLVGLLFVSLSLNVDAISREANTHLRVLAAQTFTNFLFVLLFAVLFLIPRQVPLGLGLPLLGIGGYGLLHTVSRLLEARRRHSDTRVERAVVRRLVINTIAYVALMIIAVFVLFANTDGLYWLIPVMIILIVTASSSAWDLLLHLRETPQR